MSIITRFATYLGIDRPVLHDGFTLSSRGARLPMCGSCGALVAWETQEQHRQWHRR